MPLRPPRLLAALASGVVLLGAAHPSPVAAGNGDAVPVSNEAALMGQAAVANGTGAAAMYYNPALLGRLEQARADVSGSAFHLRISQSPDLVTTPLITVPVRNTEIVSIPSALAYARPIGDDWRVGFGLFSPTAQEVQLSVALDRMEGMREGALRLTLMSESALYVGVLSVARRLAPGLWIGGSLEGVYANTRTTTFLSGRLADAMGSVVVGTDEQSELTFGGMGAQLGLTWNATPRATVALTVGTPVIALSVRGRVRVTTTAGGGGELGGDGSTFETSETRLPSARIGPVEGLSVRAGAEVRATPRLRFAVDGEVWTPMTNEALGVSVRSFWNLRAGLEGRVASSIWLAGGLFTDRQGQEDVEAFAASSIDFWGLTAGARWQSSYPLAADQARERVTFGSVLAFRYAYGRGSVGGLRANLQAADEDTALVFRPAEFVQHELGVHIGAWTAF